MGLFINQDHDPTVFKNEEDIYTSNQEVVQYHSLTELLHEQQKVNMELIRSLDELKSRYGQQKVAQKGQWNQVKHQIDALKANHLYRAQVESQLVQRLEALDEKSSQLQETVESKTLVAASTLEEVHHLRESNREMANRLKEIELTNQELSAQLNEQMNRQKEITEKLSIQEEHQIKALKRLDTQEVLTEKISRQLNHIRSIIFERTNHLAIQLEEGYKLTASHVYRLMHGTDQPLSFSLMKHKKEKQK